jgi:pimeloyl-ACP methyl ester carboxylesterase
MSFNRTFALIFPLGLLLAAGCAAFSPQNSRYEAADRTAAAAGMRKSYIKAASFTLTAYERCAGPGEHLHIYIEGDGAAWLSRTRLSDDPTPQKPLVLELALLDPASRVAYLARPGQYTAARIPGCDAAYWSGKRFSSEVAEAVNEAIDTLRVHCRAEKIHLIGYSGGAAIAVLLAARRDDVASLRTVAGNLDPEAVNRYHRVSPFTDLQNPMEAAKKLRNLPQRHFIGLRDKVVPSGIAQSFLKQTGRGRCGGITIVEDAAHTGGWRERWKELLAMPFRCLEHNDPEAPEDE